MFREAVPCPSQPPARPTGQNTHAVYTGRAPWLPSATFHALLPLLQPYTALPLPRSPRGQYSTKATARRQGGSSAGAYVAPGQLTTADLRAERAEPRSGDPGLAPMPPRPDAMCLAQSDATDRTRHTHAVKSSPAMAMARPRPHLDDLKELVRLRPKGRGADLPAVPIQQVEGEHLALAARVGKPMSVRLRVFLILPICRASCSRSLQELAVVHLAHEP